MSFAIAPKRRRIDVEEYFWGEKGSVFNSIPNEILRMIFEQVMLASSADIFFNLKNCTLVCRRWKLVLTDLQKTTFEDIASALEEEAWAKWESLFGVIDAVPNLPQDIVKILRSPCSFWPDKTVEDTHYLEIIPEVVNDQWLMLEYLQKSGENSKLSKRAKFRIAEFNNHEKNTVYRSHWVLITKRPIPDSCGKDLLSQVELLRNFNKKSKVTYQLPNLLDIVACIYLNSGTFSSFYTRCMEIGINGKQMIVGGINKRGFVLKERDNIGFNDIGIFACRHLNIETP